MYKCNTPHDNPDEFHDDFVETLEEVDHDLRFLSHFANDDTERNAEHNNTCAIKQVPW